jgi:hypothetical protein
MSGYRQDSRALLVARNGQRAVVGFSPISSLSCRRVCNRCYDFDFAQKRTKSINLLRELIFAILSDPVQFLLLIRAGKIFSFDPHRFDKVLFFKRLEPWIDATVTDIPFSKREQALVNVVASHIGLHQE